MKVYSNVSNALFELCRDVISRDYPHALVVKIPPHKDIEAILHKLECAYIRHESPTQRSRAKRRGESVFRVVVVPSQRIAWIAATNGTHPYFFKNPNLRDVRKSWVTFAGYKVKRANKARIAVTDDLYWAAWSALKSKALKASAEEIEQMIREIRWFRSDDTLRQKRMLVRYINRQRKIHHKPLLDKASALS